MDGSTPTVLDPDQIWNRCSQMPGLNHIHPYIHQMMIQYQYLQEHQSNMSQFHFLNPLELAHHPFHSTVNKHYPGCTLKCSCGLLNMQADQFYHPSKDRGSIGRSRANSEISCSP